MAYISGPVLVYGSSHPQTPNRSKANQTSVTPVEKKTILCWRTSQSCFPSNESALQSENTDSKRVVVVLSEAFRWTEVFGNDFVNCETIPYSAHPPYSQTRERCDFASISSSSGGPAEAFAVGVVFPGKLAPKNGEPTACSWLRARARWPWPTLSRLCADSRLRKTSDRPVRLSSGPSEVLVESRAERCVFSTAEAVYRRNFCCSAF